MSLVPQRLTGEDGSQIVSVQNNGLRVNDIIADGIARGRAFQCGNIQLNKAANEHIEYFIRLGSGVTAWIFAEIRGVAVSTVKLYQTTMNNIEEEKNHLPVRALNRAIGGTSGCSVYENVRPRARGNWLTGGIANINDPLNLMWRGGSSDCFYLRVQPRGASVQNSVIVTLVLDD